MQKTESRREGTTAIESDRAWKGNESESITRHNTFASAGSNGTEYTSPYPSLVESGGGTLSLPNFYED